MFVIETKNWYYVKINCFNRSRHESWFRNFLSVYRTITVLSQISFTIDRQTNATDPVRVCWTHNLSFFFRHLLLLAVLNWRDLYSAITLAEKKTLELLFSHSRKLWMAIRTLAELLYSSDRLILEYIEAAAREWKSEPHSSSLFVYSDMRIVF